MTQKAGTYSQPNVNAVAPDAVVFIDSDDQGLKRTIALFDNTGKKVEVDFMSFVESISVSKGIDNVPGSASINVKMPKHFLNGVYGSLKDILATMLEIEIYMKGRFVAVTGEPQYYPVFWGVISNISESKSAGDLIANTITCQDMMRWLAITKVEIKSAAYTSSVGGDTTGQASKNTVSPYSSFYVELSTPGIIRDLLSLSIDEHFFVAQNIEARNIGIIGKGNVVTPVSSTDLLEQRHYSEQVMNVWREKFKQLASALYIYGFLRNETVQNNQNVTDVVLDTVAYIDIYGSRKVMVKEPAADTKFVGPNGEQRTIKGYKQVEKDVPWMDITHMFSAGAAPFNVQQPPIFQSVFQNRLDVANQAKDQVHLEFYQDVDGTIILKPQFYNMDTRQNPVYVIDDIDIQNTNFTEDETQVITRIDVTGTPINGWTFPSESGNPYYGFALDFDKLQKYGLRIESVTTNFITSSDDAVVYAQQELAKRNSLIYNGSITIQGRPEIKLGYPIYISSEDAFYYVTGIDHSFTFGGSFDTTLTLTARRRKKTDVNGNALVNLLIECTGSPVTQQNIVGKNTENDDINPMNNLTMLCDPNSSSQFTAERPNYNYRTVDDLLQYQGNFKYIDNKQSSISDPRTVQQVTDNEGYELIGIGYPFGKDLILTEDLRIVPKNNKPAAAGLASAMTLSVKGQQSPTLRFQQPLTLDQIQNVQVVSQRSKSNIAATMTANSANNDLNNNDVFRA